MRRTPGRVGAADVPAGSCRVTSDASASTVANYIVHGRTLDGMSRTIGRATATDTSSDDSCSWPRHRTPRS